MYDAFDSLLNFLSTGLTIIIGASRHGFAVRSGSVGSAERDSGRTLALSLNRYCLGVSYTWLMDSMRLPSR